MRLNLWDYCVTSLSGEKHYLAPANNSPTVSCWYHGPYRTRTGERTGEVSRHDLSFGGSGFVRE